MARSLSEAARAKMLDAATDLVLDVGVDRLQRRRGRPPLRRGEDDDLPALPEREGAPRRRARPGHGGTADARHRLAPQRSARVPRERAPRLRRRRAAEPVLRDLRRLGTRPRAAGTPADVDARPGGTDQGDLRQRPGPRRARRPISTTRRCSRSSRARSSCDRCSGPRHWPTSTSKPWPTACSPVAPSPRTARAVASRRRRAR